MLLVVSLMGALLAVAVTAVPVQPAADDDVAAVVLPVMATDGDIATIIMDGFVDTGDDSRDGRLDNGAEAFAFDGVLDIGQLVERDGVAAAADLVAEAVVEDVAIDQRSGGAKLPKPMYAEGVLDTSNLYGNVGVEGRPE